MIATLIATHCFLRSARNDRKKSACNDRAFCHPEETPQSVDVGIKKKKPTIIRFLSILDLLCQQVLPFLHGSNFLFAFPFQLQH